MPSVIKSCVTRRVTPGASALHPPSDVSAAGSLIARDAQAKLEAAEKKKEAAAEKAAEKARAKAAAVAAKVWAKGPW